MFEYFETDDCPARVILTDDPLRLKMLAAHHLEDAALVYERGDSLVYFGRYEQAAIALAAVGFERGAVSEFIRGTKESAILEVVYIGGCAGTTEKQALRTVILAKGGSQRLIDHARTAAGQHGIPVKISVVSPIGGAAPGCGGIADDVTGALYEKARISGVEALSILTVSENTLTGEKMEEHERRSRFYAAARLVFETLNY